MTNYETNEVMALEIAELLNKYNVFHDTNIFYNAKLMTVDSDTQELTVKENIDITTYVEHGNPDMITLQYQGNDSLYMIVNGFAKDVESIKKANRIVSELIKLGDRHNRWYELGSDTSMYFVSDEEDVFSTIDKFNFNPEVE